LLLEAFPSESSNVFLDFFQSVLFPDFIEIDEIRMKPDPTRANLLQFLLLQDEFVGVAHNLDGFVQKISALR